MAIRPGMAYIIDYVREITQASEDDITDGALQRTLDRYRHSYKSHLLDPVPEYVSGDWVYFEYPIPGHFGMVEAGQGSDSGWRLVDDDGTDATGYSVNYEAGIITFDADTKNATYYLSARGYNVDYVIADVFEHLASISGGMVDWSSDNHSVKASQKRGQYEALARAYRRRGGAVVKRMGRIDER